MVYQKMRIMIVTSQNRVQGWASLCHFFVLMKVEVSQCQQHLAVLFLQESHAPAMVWG